MASSAYHQKKIAVINDLSGFGRCSLTVAIPVISSMKIQCCPVPTSILSSHTGYPHYFFHDCTNLLEPYLESWKALDLHFDAISSMNGHRCHKEHQQICNFSFNHNI